MNKHIIRKALSVIMAFCMVCPYFSMEASAGGTDTRSIHQSPFTAESTDRGANTTINIAAISGVTAPVAGQAPVTAISAGGQYTGTITWAPNDSTFVGGRVYSANIALTPKSGYTLTGVAKNFFTVSGAASVKNAADSGYITAVFPTTATAGGSIIYVNKSAAGNNDGTSWTDAYTDLQPAIAAAISGTQIWVAAGTYKPTTGADRSVSFAMKEGVALFGGFAGTETALSQRDYAANETILSGDLSGNDVVNDTEGDGIDIDDLLNYGDNTFHVVTCTGLSSTAVLDGFTISGGYADDGSGGSPNLCGAGMYIYQSSPTLSNLLIRYNVYLMFGGGIYMTDGTNGENHLEDALGTSIPSSPVLTNVTLSMNRYRHIGGGSGGGIYNFGGNPVLSHVTFDQNETQSAGGGMVSYGAPILNDVVFSKNIGGNELGGGGLDIEPKNNILTAETPAVYLTNVTFSGNNTLWEGSVGNGGGMANRTIVYLTDVTFTGNNGTYGGGFCNEAPYDDIPPTAILNHVTFDSNTAYFTIHNNCKGGGMFNAGSASLDDVTFVNNSAEYLGGGMYSNTNFTTTLSNVSFTGNSADYGGGMYQEAIESTHFDPKTNYPITLDKVSFTENHANNDGGGLYNDYATADLTDVTFTKNTADASGGGLANGNLYIINDIVSTITSLRYYSMTMKGVSFIENSAGGGGGGAYTAGGFTAFYNPTFTGNKATSGGGLYVPDYFPDNDAGNLITNAVFSGNSAQYGGGVSIEYAMRLSTYITDTLICDNTASADGGGIWSSAIFGLCNTTIAGNKAEGTGGGIYTFDSITFMANSIIWGNAAKKNYSGIHSDIKYTSPGDSRYGNNIIQEMEPISIYEDDGGNMDVDPQFADDGSYRLKDTSPAIDSGSAYPYLKVATKNDLATIAYGRYKPSNLTVTFYRIDRVVTDLDSNSRLVDGYYDIGAYEGQNIGSISGTVTDSGGNPLSGAAVTVSDCGYTATTGADGSYTVRAVAAGTHTVTAALSGYQNASVTGVTVTADQTTSSVALTAGEGVAPTVSSVSPSGIGIPVSGNIAVTFSEAMNTNTTAGAVSLDGGTTALTGGSWSAGNTVYTAAYSGLSYFTEYTATISGFKDSAGNTMVTDSAHTFKTETDTYKPTVVSVTPSGADITSSGDIAVTFSEAMNTTAGAVSLDGGTTTLTGGTWSAGNTVYTAAYSGLTHGTAYTVTISGFKDAAGNEMATVAIPLYYQISGTVKGSDKSSGLAATLQLKKNGIAAGAPVTANADGTYLIDGVLKGTYTIAVSMTGYTAGTINAFNIADSNASGKDITLQKISGPGKTLVSISVSGPTKTIYKIGEPFDETGLVVTATYSDGSSAAVTGYSLSGFDSTTTGVKTINVSFGGKTASFTVTVQDKTLTSISVIPPTKTVYAIGESFDAAGMKVTASYDDGTTADVTTQASIGGFDNSSEGIKTITVSYGGMTSTFIIEVEGKNLLSITVVPPTQTVYAVNESFNRNGMQVIANYDDETTEDVTGQEVLSGFDSSAAGTKTVTATYNGKSGSFTVTIKKKELLSITVAPPTKTEYWTGEELDLAGMIVTALFNDNTTGSIAVSAAKISGYNKNRAGSQTVTVTYNGKKATFKVTVKEKAALDSIQVQPPAKMTYYVGDEFDRSGMQVTAVYSDGTTEDVTSLADVIGFSSKKAGTDKIKIKYLNKSEALQVTILEAQPTSFIVNSSEITIKKNKSFQLKVEAIYSDGEKVLITRKAKYGSSDKKTASVNIRGKITGRKYGTAQITISYGGLQQVVTVTVAAN